MIGIIDYGLSNIGSISNAVNKLNHSYQIISNSKNLNKIDKIILPGVGNFKKAIANLKKQNLFDSLKDFITDKKKPFLGICLGMQILYNHSSEDGGENGLGVINGKVKQLMPSKKFKVPNVGWREIEILKKGVLINQFIDKPIFYFVHKYACYSEEKINTVAQLNYINQFDCIIEKENIFGTQFHPEKSQKNGLQLLNNFLKI
uniref:Imidazole glycerol phosphate synthase subunit HisH n=1 Tax=uncultured marine bacterium 440 TaxID=257390 RepID=Q6SHC1_9BACT|nr:imidazole glycerol phosphate synthase, glutamine amidotransferase subunit [uncultured marine bacterium 440]